MNIVHSMFNFTPPHIFTQINADKEGGATSGRRLLFLRSALICAYLRHLRIQLLFAGLTAILEKAKMELSTKKPAERRAL